MQNKIILYEPIELQNTVSIDDLEIYHKIKDNKSIKNLEVYVSFFEE